MTIDEAVHILRQSAPNGWKPTPGGSISPVMDDVCDWTAFWLGSRKAIGAPTEAVVTILNAALAVGDKNA